MAKPAFQENQIPAIARHVRDIVAKHGPDCLEYVTQALMAHADAMMNDAQLMEAYPVFSKSTLYNWRAKKGFPYRKIDGKVFYRKREVDEWFDRFKVAE